jgi:hypothetical protein
MIKNTMQEVTHYYCDYCEAKIGDFSDIFTVKREPGMRIQNMRIHDWGYVAHFCSRECLIPYVEEN